MKVKLIPSTKLVVELDGVPLSGEFRVESEWNGMVKLVRDAPLESIIIHKPALPKNPWDCIPSILGGNKKPSEDNVSVEAEVVSTTIKTEKQSTQN